MDQYEEIGVRIKKLRKDVGMSQRILAKNLGYDTDTAVSLIESGSRKLSIEKLMRISTIFEVSVGMLLGQDSDETKKEEVEIVLINGKGLVKVLEDIIGRSENQAEDFSARGTYYHSLETLISALENLAK